MSLLQVLVKIMIDLRGLSPLGQIGSLTFVLSFVLSLIPSNFFSQIKPVLVQPEVQYQRMDGFGVTIGNGSAREIMNLPGTERAKLLDLVFGADGLRLNIIRSEIAWTGKRLAFTHPMYLRGFIYYFADDENETAQFDLYREAKRRQDEMIINSCVWTPPPQWKTNESFRDGGELLPKHYDDFATYLVAYLEFYKKLRNLDIQVISLQNEPESALPFQSCIWKSDQLKQFLKVVGKQFKERGIPTKLMLPELNWAQLGPYLQPTLEDVEARDLISHIGAHSYLGTTTDKAAAKGIYKRQNYRLWQTEFALPPGEKSSGIEGGLTLAGQMLNDLAFSDCQAWLYWTLVAPAGWNGRLGLMEKEGTSIKPTKRFWCFSQFSRFLPKNSVRISAAGGLSPVIAFRNPEYNRITLIFINPTQEPANETLEMSGWNLERMIAYRTSEKEDFAQIPLPPQSGSQIPFHLEPKSVTTLTAQIRRIR